MPSHCPCHACTDLQQAGCSTRPNHLAAALSFSQRRGCRNDPTHRAHLTALIAWLCTPDARRQRMLYKEFEGRKIRMRSINTAGSSTWDVLHEHAARLGALQSLQVAQPQRHRPPCYTSTAAATETHVAQKSPLVRSLSGLHAPLENACASSRRTDSGFNAAVGEACIHAWAAGRVVLRGNMANKVLLFCRTCFVG